MIIAVSEVSPGIGRWCATLVDRFDMPILSAFSDKSAEDARYQLQNTVFDLIRFRREAKERLEHTSNSIKEYLDGTWDGNEAGWKAICSAIDTLLGTLITWS